MKSPSYILKCSSISVCPLRRLMTAPAQTLRVAEQANFYERLLPRIRGNSLTRIIEKSRDRLNGAAESGSMKKPDWTVFKKSQLERMVAVCMDLCKLQQDRKECEYMMIDFKNDVELNVQIEKELKGMDLQRQQLELSLLRLLLSDYDSTTDSAILEIRAGTGGDEAGVFALDMFRMYQRYALSQHWKVQVLSRSEGATPKSLKEIVASVNGPAAYDRLKYESGVHRVQRVPITEASGRIHTSTITVAVLPEENEQQHVLDPKDIKIELRKSSGAGGQSVNKTESAVRITHLPTGLVASSQDERDQHTNRIRALRILTARVAQRQKELAESERASARLQQIGSGSRSEKIRTYNYAQNRVSDHRIGYSSQHLDAIMDGEDQFHELLNELAREDELKQLDERLDLLIKR